MGTFTHGSAAWDVAAPDGPGPLPGVTMAGFDVRDLDDVRPVPHPSVTVAVDFGSGASTLEYGPGRYERGSLAVGAGIGSGGGVRAYGRDVACLQIRLSPVVARRHLGAPPSTLDGKAVPLGALWGADAARVRERLAEARSWPQRFALAHAFLARRRSDAAFVDREVAWAWHRIAATRGRARIDGLATELGWSRKRLWTRFRAQLGLAPKRAAALVRFDDAAHRLVAGYAPAHVAAASGYADQSHLHRDVVAFTGATPANVTREPFLAVDPIAWPAGGFRP